MNCIDKTYRETFENTLKEHGSTFQHDADNIYSIVHNNTPDRITTAKLITSELINGRKHGTKNNTEINAIGYFLFELLTEEKEPNLLYIFAFSNRSDNRVEFVIVPFAELKNRLNQRNRNTPNNQKTELLLWLLPDGCVFEATNFGAEGEWWFLGGRMAKNTVLDYTTFRNDWNCLVM